MGRVTVNIKAVAKKAEVSITTVSRVLNSPDLVAKKTREKVLGVIEELEYTPNWFASNIQSSKTKVIGLLVSDILNPTNMEITKGIEEIAHKKGYSINLCHTEFDPVKEWASIEMLMNRNVDGLVLISSVLKKKDFNKIKNKRIPFVLVDKAIHSASENIVFTDYKSSAKEAVSHLIDLNRKNIAILLDAKAEMESKEKLDGYKEALKDANILFKEDNVIYCLNNIVEGYVATSKLLSKDSVIEECTSFKSNRIDAIFTASDNLAFGAIERIKQSGLSIPEDIAVVGFDDLKVGAVVEPKLTTVSKPAYRMGLMGIRLLLDLIDGENSDGLPEKIMVKCKLKVRKSCGNRDRLKELW